MFFFCDLLRVLAKDEKNMNKRCQVFTPAEIVDKILDKVGYTNNLFGKKILENACGNGNILTIIVERYIEDGIRNGYSLDTIKYGLENDIYGIELDKKTFKKCIRNLSRTAEKYDIYYVHWHIYNGDALKLQIHTFFDFIVGNPPYIVYKELDLETREFVKKTYEVCSDGKFDYCYAFIEAGLKSLKGNGKLAYIVPNSLFKNVFAERLRTFILPHLTHIYDYKTKKIFEVLTSSAIMICEKDSLSEKIYYFDLANNNQFTINKSSLHGKWIFKPGTVQSHLSIGKAKFSDYFNASIAIATLYNKAFVIKNYIEDGQYILTEDGNKIEKAVTRPAASPRSLSCNKGELIIFPYFYRDNQLNHYAEEIFFERFPYCVLYLKKYKQKLQQRNFDKNVKWFEYGRSQALAHINQQKLLTSTVITRKVEIYNLSEEIIPYSGIYITAHSSYSLDVAKNILQSDEFLQYINDIGINASGISLRISAKDINNFNVSL
jgi:tRNA1(Val) A37 N6-methylase TrmN6